MSETQRAVTESGAAAVAERPAALGVARRLSAAAERIDDWLNPIVVKELRQAVSGRFVAAILLFFLTIQSFVLGMFLLFMTDMSINDDAGASVFMFMRAVVLFVGVFAVPVHAGFRLNAERTDPNADLMNVTTLKPRKIVSGKFLSAMLVALVIYSASAPFLSLTFLLRGIDLPTVLVVLFFDLTFVALAIMGMIFLACIPAVRMLRWLLLLGAAFGLFMSYGSLAFSVLWVMMVMSSFGGGGPSFAGVMSVSMTGELWVTMGVWLACVLLALGFMHYLAGAMLTVAAANRALAPRVYTTFLWAATLGCAAVGCYTTTSLAPMVMWVWTMVFLHCVGMFISASERDAPGPRVAATIPADGLRRASSFLFYSGSAGGLLWNCLSIGATLAVGALSLGAFKGAAYSGMSVDRAALEHALTANALFAMYIAVYVLAAHCLRRTVLSNVILPVNTYAIALILMGLGTILPLILAIVMPGRGGGLSRALDTDAMITIPFTAWGDAENAARWWFVGILLAVMGALNLLWMMESYSRFRRPSAAAEARAVVPVALTSREHTDAAAVARAEAALAAATGRAAGAAGEGVGAAAMVDLNGDGPVDMDIEMEMDIDIEAEGEMRGDRAS